MDGFFPLQQHDIDFIQIRPIETPKFDLKDMISKGDLEVVIMEGLRLKTAKLQAKFPRTPCH